MQERKEIRNRRDSGRRWRVFGALHAVRSGRKMVSKRDTEGSKPRKIIWHWPCLYALKGFRQDKH